MDYRWFRLDSAPFENRSDAKLFQSTPDRECALGQLLQHAQYGQGVALLLGDSGIGKTMLLRTLLLRLHATDHGVILTWPLGADRDVVREACKRFGVGVPFSKDRNRAARRLMMHLEKTAEAGHRSVLIIDQAENMTADQWSQLSVFATTVFENPALLRIILSGRNSLKHTLERPELLHFRRHVVLETVLSGANLAETREYVRSRLQWAGRSDGDLFDEDAIDLIHRAARGNPRSVNAAATRAMEAARFASERRVRGVRIALPAQGVAEQITPTPPTSTTFVEPAAESVSAVESQLRANGGCVGLADDERVNETTGAYHNAETRFGGGRGVYGAAIDTPAPTWSGDATPSPLGEPSRPVVNTQAVQHDAPTSQRYETDATMLARFEQLVVRAERAAGALEGLLRETLTTQERVSSQRDRAERLSRDLGSSTEQAEDALHEVRRRTTEIVDETERRVTDVHGQISRVFESLSASEPLRKIQAACEQAEEIELRIRAFDEHSNEMFDRNSKRLEAMTGRAEEASSIHQRLGEVVQQAKSLQTKADETAQRWKHNVERQTAQLDAARAKIVEDARDGIRALRSEWQTVESNAKKRSGSLRSEVQSITDQMEKLAESGLSRWQARMENALVEQSSRREQAIRDEQSRAESIESAAKVRTERLRSELQSITDQMEQLAESGLSRWQVRMEKTIADETARRDQAIRSEQAKAEKVIEDLMETTAAAARTGESVRHDLVQWQSQARETTEETCAAIHQAMTTADEARRRSESMVTQQVSELTKVESAAESATRRALETIADVQSMVGSLVEQANREVKEIEHLVGAAEGRYGGLKFRLEDMLSQTDKLGDEVARHEQSATTMRAALDPWLDRADTVVQRVREAVEQGETFALASVETVGKLDVLRTSVATTLVELGAAHERVRPLADQVTAAESRLTDLANSCTQGKVIHDQLSKAIDSSKQWQDAARQVSTLIDEKSRQLDSHSAAAISTVRQLSEATIAGQALVGQAQETAKSSDRKAKETREQVDQLIQEVWTLTSTTESRLKELRSTMERSSDIVRRIEELTDRRDTLHESLVTQVHNAEQQVQLIEERSSQATVLAERLVGVTPLVKIVKDTEASLRTLIEEAGRLHGDLASTTTSGVHHSAELQQLTTTARSLIDTQQQLLRQVEEAVTVLNERLDEGRGTVEASDRLRREFTTQAEEIRSGIEQWQRQAVELNEMLGSALTKPREVVAAAQTQAAQLERVCGVVRKVFAGLSQTSLDAVQKTKEFKTMSESAANRLAQLSTETERASATLHEWVAEAVRVQSRLEKTLQTAPPISATHSGEALNRLSRTLQSSGLAASAQSAGELRKLPDVTPNRMAATTGAPTASQKPTGRAEQISALIEEAKQSAAMVGA